MKYSIDRIIDDVAVLQNLDNLEMIDVPLNVLPNSIKDGDVIVFNDGIYMIDNKLKDERYNRIKEKMDRLKNLNK